MSIESSAAARRYFPHVNLLRAFAALSVVVYHIIEHYKWDDFPRLFGLIWFRIGWMSVDLFFVISGFVIAWSLIQLHQKHQNFRPLAKEFLWRRGGRIVPLYVLTMLAFAFTVGHNLLYFAAWPHWVAHLTFIHPFFPQTFGSINGVNWSVGMEVHFYIFALITSPFWVRRKPLTILVTLVLTAWALRGAAWEIAQYLGVKSVYPIMVQMPLMLDEFGAGMALALFIHRYPLEKWRGSLLQQGFVLVALAIGTMTLAINVYWQDAVYWNNPNMVIFWRTLIALAFASLILLFIWLPAFKKPPLWYRASYYLGDISYGIYLWHLPVILLWKPYIAGNPHYYLLATMPCILVLSAASWHWVEKPMIRWSKTRSLA